LRSPHEARTRAALAIWHESIDPRGTPGETYLREDRRLDCDDDFSSFLRWHERSHALIGLFRDITTNEPRAITRIFLDAENHKISRKFFGPVGGCVIKIDPDENVTTGCVIAEGLETSLATRQLGYLPIWALGSVGAIERFPVLDGIEGLTILAEAGEPSRKAVQICFERWRAAGRDVIVQKSTIGSDINDAVRGAI
jgi:putative DNA primase/helicase